MLLIPIRTESPIRRTPWVNYALIAANVLVFLFLDLLGGPALTTVKERYFVLEGDWPRLYQFFTYQFAHGDWQHLLGNMLFLWVFGNSVNGKLRHVPYLLFYLAAGVFAGAGYVLLSNATLLGASGSIAAVTTAYLVLFPRSRVTVLFWFFYFVETFEWPATVLIGVKIILWDNILAPRLGSGPEHVAYSAHLYGYGFGFGAALLMLGVRALPRDQFDLLALWDRWRRRRVFAAVMSDPQARAQAQFGRVARVAPASASERQAEEQRLDAIAGLRTRIAAHLEDREAQAAATLYEQLVNLDPQQCLSERGQATVARACYDSGRYPQSVAAFERYLQQYPASPDADDVRLLVGIMYARDLGQLAQAEQHLQAALAAFVGGGARREQAARWLNDVRAAMGTTGGL